MTKKQNPHSYSHPRSPKRVGREKSADFCLNTVFQISWIKDGIIGMLKRGKQSCTHRSDMLNMIQLELQRSSQGYKRCPGAQTWQRQKVAEHSDTKLQLFQKQSQPPEPDHQQPQKKMRAGYHDHKTDHPPSVNQKIEQLKQSSNAQENNHMQDQ